MGPETSSVPPPPLLPHPPSFPPSYPPSLLFLPLPHSLRLLSSPRSAWRTVTHPTSRAPRLTSHAPDTCATLPIPFLGPLPARGHKPPNCNPQRNVTKRALRIPLLLICTWTLYLYLTHPPRTSRCITISNESAAALIKVFQFKYA